MPIRPQHLAAMTATIVESTDSTTVSQDAEPVTVTFESGHRQTVARGQARPLARGHGGIVAVDAGADTRYLLFAGIACHPTLALRSDRGPVEFELPVRAGSIRVE